MSKLLKKKLAKPNAFHEALRRTVAPDLYDLFHSALAVGGEPNKVLADVLRLQEVRNSNDIAESHRPQTMSANFMPSIRPPRKKK